MKKEPITEKIQIIVSYILRLSIIIAIIGAIWNKNWEVVFFSSLALGLTFLPALIERNYKIYLPAELEFIIILFIYAALYLGGIKGYYTSIWWWDVILHFASAIALGFIGFLIMYVLYHEKKVKTSPILIALFSFCFALAIGATWEIYEFAVDSFFGFNMQKSGLIDTMWDLIVNSIGGLIAAIVGYFYVKGGPSLLFKHLINHFVEENPKLFKKN